jgi:ABC-type antimicrobial peptide transport system permease subunit
LAAEVFAGTALLALIVAGVGIYGTVAYTVSQQRHEMGVRLALGARRSGILRLVVGGGLRVVGIGLVVGAILVLVLGRLVTSMLYGTTAHDPVMFLVVATSMLAVAVAACAIPAWRAAHLDPVALLRSE